MARPYKSAQRERAAAVTRLVVLDAAEALFTSRGFARTTVADIAREADVAVTTVYGSVGSKAEIAIALIERGTSNPRIAETVAAVRGTTAADEAIRTLSAGVCTTMQELLPLIAVMYSAAPTEPAVADAVAVTERQYRDNLAPVAEHLLANGWLRPDVGREDVLDILWFYFGVTALRTLADLGWPWDRTQAWLARQAISALVTP